MQSPSIGGIFALVISDDAGGVLGLLQQRPDWPLAGWAMGMAACRRLGDLAALQKLEQTVAATLSDPEYRMLSVLTSDPAVEPVADPAWNPEERCQWEFCMALRSWGIARMSQAFEHLSNATNSGARIGEQQYAKQWLFARPTEDASGPKGHNTPRLSASELAHQLVLEANRLHVGGKPALAIEMMEAAQKVDPRLGAPDGDDSDWANRLWVWAEALRLNGYYRLACARFQDAQSIHRRLGAPTGDDTSFATRLFLWADALRMSDQYPLACAKLHDAQSVDPRLGAPTRDDADWATRLYWWAYALLRSGHYRLACAKFQEAQSVDPRLGAPTGDDTNWATRLWVWANSLRIDRQHALACTKFQEAQSVDPRLGAPIGDDAHFADRLWVWADALRMSGQYPLACAKHHEAQSVDPRLGAPTGDDANWATRLWGWADALRRNGQHPLACAEFHEAQSVDPRLGAPTGDGADWATRLYWWAEALRQSGRHPLACAKFQKAQSVDPRLGAPTGDDADWSSRLVLWAESLRLCRQYSLACDRYQLAQSIDPRLGAPTAENANWARRLVSWAVALQFSGRLEEACSKYEQSAGLYAGLPEPNVPDHAWCRFNWSHCLFELGRLGEALDRLREAGELARKASGSEALIHGQILRHLARVSHALAEPHQPSAHRLRAQGVLEEAVKLEDVVLRRLFETDKKQLRQELLGEAGYDLPLTSALAIQAWEQHTPVGPFALDVVLRRKGLLDEWEAVWRAQLRQSPSPEIQQQAEAWRERRTRWLEHQLETPGPAVGEAKRQEHAETTRRLEQEVADLEQSVLSALPGLQTELKRRQAGLAEVAAALPPGSVLVEYVQFSRSEFRLKPNASPETKRAWYVALVLPAGCPEAVRLIDLGMAEPINSAVKELVAELSQEAQKKVVDSVRFDALRTAVAQRVWAPVAVAVGTAWDVYLAPDGELHHLAFGLLPGRDTPFLQDEHALSYVHTGRDLLPAAPVSIPAGPAALVAGPDFDLGWDGISEPKTGLGRFVSCPTMKQEGTAIRRSVGGTQWKDPQRVQFLAGDQATKEQLLALRSPRLLHVASHGFRLPYQAPPEGGWRPEHETQLTLSELRHCQSPLLRCGIALAGANQGTTAGLLLAADVEAMDLAATELAVLSLCHGGAGDAQPGEGLYGLNRALSLAGVATRVCALWEVPGQATQLLMGRFYQNLLERRMGRLEALREAQLLLRTLTQEELDRVKQQQWPTLVTDPQRNSGSPKPYAHPTCWAAFTLQGQRSPLSSPRSSSL